MSITNSVNTCGVLPNLNFEPSHRSKSRITSYSYSSSFAISYNQDQSVLWKNYSWRVKKDVKNRRTCVVRSVVQPGAPPPSESPFNFINWIVGIVIAVILPFFSRKWISLLKLKDEVESAVEAVEEIVEVVEKVAEEVEKVAEDIADDLPEGGSLRKTVDFVEHVAERANKDAHLIGDFIDKVQEVEKKVDEYVDHLGEHAIGLEHQKEEDRAHQPPKDETKY